jgi:hypothetical protein
MGGTEAPALLRGIMQNAARIMGNLPAVGTAELFLGPADVQRAKASDVHVELPDGALVPVQLAFAFPYEPSVGDTLLVIGKDGQHYAIGVLRGTGKASLSFHGDVEVRAVGGTLTLEADKGIEMNGPEVAVRASTLRMVAEKVVQKFTWLHQRVAALASLHAKEVHTVAEESATTNAKSVTITTEEMVTVNGKQIHLG